MWSWLILVAIGLIGQAPDSRREEPDAARNPPTIPIHVLARDIQSYRGQVVRTCGRRLEPAIHEKDGRIVYWTLTAPYPSGRRGWHSGVILSHCGARPRLSNDCVTGRVAREDESLDIPEVIIVGGHTTMSHEWWLHLDCARQGGRR
jgi:hypothetical protein